VKFRLGTYNIHRAIGVDRRFRPDRIASLVAEHDPDVLLLQEVDDDVPRSKRLDLGRELAEALGYPHCAIGHNVRLRQGRYGNCTLSRFPIERSRNIDLTIGRRKRRGCQHTTLLLPSRGGTTSRLEVFNLHLGLLARERRMQAGLLASSAEIARLRAAQPTIVAGDFNDWRNLLRPLFVDTMNFRCATDRKTKGGPRSIRTYPSLSPQGGLDKVFYRGRIHLLKAFACRHQLAKLASDHLPVFAEFSLG
jgi:endonuclease/exonuclease/phosphatase family metal-dependent hydrolase